MLFNSVFTIFGNMLPSQIVSDAPFGFCPLFYSEGLGQKLPVEILVPLKIQQSLPHPVSTIQFPTT